MNIQSIVCRMALPLLLHLVLLGMCLPATAAGTRLPYGKVVLLSGSVHAIDPVSGKSRKLKVGDVVYVDERTVASAASEAVIRTNDAGVIAVRPGASFAVDRFTNNGSTEDRFSVNIIEGALRMISGLIGKRDPGHVKVSTAASTVGIRGTDFEPFVLSVEQSDRFQQPAGTYNRVYRGATYLENSSGKLDVAAGEVGFAPQPSDLAPKGLLTLLMPVILEKVPSFFIPGRFDGQLERFVDPSGRSPVAPGKTKETAKTVAPVALVAEAAYQGKPLKDMDPCKTEEVAQAWLAYFDESIAQRDAQRVLAIFDPQVKVSVIVRTSNGQQRTATLNREEMVRSTLSSLANVSDFKTARNALKAKAADTQCRKIELESVVIESGLRGGNPYRFESVENFELELQNGNWRATSAAAKQR